VQIHSDNRRSIDPPAAARKPDYDNELTQLVFDINTAVENVAGNKNRSKLIRRLRRALEKVK